MRPAILVTILSLAATTLLARPASAADVAENWSKKCASCHGKDGTAETTMGRKQKIKDMTTGEWQSKITDAHIKEVILNGVKDTKMKPFKDKLSDDEVTALVKYVRGLKK
jgi:cytochrome c553